MRARPHADNRDMAMQPSTWRQAIAPFCLTVILITSCAKRQEPSVKKMEQPEEASVKASPDARMSAPPDLRECTRIDVQYMPSTLRRFFSTPERISLLSASEKEYLQSLETIVVDDPAHIRAFADDIREGSYSGIRPSAGLPPMARLLCYNGDGPCCIIFVFDRTVTTVDDRMWEYRGASYGRWMGPLMRSLLVLTPQLRPFELRGTCARRIEAVFLHMDLRADLLSKEPPKYPSPDTWCDAVLNHYLAKHVSGSIEGLFRCPAVQQGRCHYAMNPNCRPDSPPETVLLFETAPGWNQHGGAELFTFDNHDPKGGCVLLNDGAVKFIRAEEELKQLRWK